MTNDASSNPHGWLNPLSDHSVPLSPLVVDIKQLEAAGSRILSEPLIAQRLVTAARLRHGFNLAEEGDVQKLVLSRWGHSLPSAVAVLMPLGEPGLEPSAKRIRRKYQEELLASQANWPDLAAVRDTAFLLCADHKPPEYGLPDQLYRHHQPEAMVSWAGIPLLLEQLTKAVSPAAAPAWIQARPALREALATIIAETFKNTHDHAREDIDGSDLQTSVRAVYARYYPLAAALSEIAAVSADGVTPVERYVRSFAPRSVKPGLRVPEQPSIDGFLELTIFDSGPGMAARWLRRTVHELDPKEQLEAVLHCFGKGRTTTGSLGRGFGLWKVLTSLVGLHGFISVRTNSIHAYRQFSYSSMTGHEELPGGQRVPKELLYDWKRGLSTNPSSYPHVQGTVVSFLLPMGQA